MRTFVLVAILTASAAPASSAVLTATPETVRAVMARAASGDTVRLAPGDYGKFELKGLSWGPAVTIDSSEASFSAIVLRNVQGVTLEGGTVTGPGGGSFGVHLVGVQNVTVGGMKVSGSHRGVVVAESQDVRITRMTLDGLISDGINVAYSWRVRVDGNSCSNFRPNKAVWENGRMLRDGDHPDCIQAWSRPESQPVSDLEIVNNRIDGDMQGIGLFNPMPNGVSAGGFDRVLIEGNVIRVGFPHAIAMYSGRDSIIRNNTISAVPGATMPNNGTPVRATITVKYGRDNLVCGNRMETPTAEATQRCPRN